jgi:hypothetical protein
LNLLFSQIEKVRLPISLRRSEKGIVATPDNNFMAGLNTEDRSGKEVREEVYGIVGPASA